MTRVLAPFFVTVSLVLLTGCGGADPDTHEKVMRDSLDVMKEMTQVLAKITDEASAKQHAPELAQIGERMEAIDERQDALDPPSVERQQELEAQFGEELETVMRAFMEEGMRIAMNPALNKHVEDALPKVEAQ